MREGMLFGAFLGDAFSLGAHWIYDTKIIDEKFGYYDKIYPPLKDSFHKNRNIGDHTHYGDQMLFLLESITYQSGFNPNRFKSYWISKMKDYTGYIDNATKESLDNYESGLNYGSSSSELGGAARIAPILYFYQEPDKGIESCIEQTAITHNSEKALACSAFFAKLVYRILEGENPSFAIKNLEAEFQFNHWVHREIENAFKSISTNTREAIKKLGQSSECSEAFASTLHLILKYEGVFKTAMIENVRAGGDCAARGILTGMILGAYEGFEKLPKDWLLTMKSTKKIEHLIY